MESNDQTPDLKRTIIPVTALSEQCLNRRIGDIETFRREVKAWQDARNASGKGADWQLTTKDARIKLKRLYPQN